jgi:mRNA interferase RelE/StbE
MPRNVVGRIREKLAQIAEDPFARHPNTAKLQDRAGYRLRVGDWRVIYDIQQEELVIIVITIAPRGEVYR